MRQPANSRLLQSNSLNYPFAVNRTDRRQTTRFRNFFHLLNRLRKTFQLTQKWSTEKQWRQTALTDLISRSLKANHLTPQHGGIWRSAFSTSIVVALVYLLIDKTSQKAYSLELQFHKTNWMFIEGHSGDQISLNAFASPRPASSYSSSLRLKRSHLFHWSFGQRLLYWVVEKLILRIWCLCCSWVDGWHCNG